MIRPWTDEETKIARQMLGARASDDAFISVLGRTKRAARNRIQWLDNPNIRASGAQRNAEYRRRIREQKGGGLLIHKTEPAARPPDEVIAEMVARNSAPRSITAALFGDPPKGFSALDRKMAAT